MGRKTGSADLPLHGGRVPAWLATRMAKLGRVLVEAIVLEFGRDELLRRLAHPFWFQSLGCVMGMDWHSSGITTSVVGALKRGLDPVADELGIRVCGGRGRHSRATPAELGAWADRTGLDGADLARTSRLVAKVDSAAVQDGFDLYLHGFFVTADGKWAVVQQGMDTGRRQARRYHWLSEGLESFVDEPHTAIDDHPRGVLLNLTDRRARPSRNGQLELLGRGPDAVIAPLRRSGLAVAARPAARSTAQPALPHLAMPARHEVRADDVRIRRLWGALAAAAERGPVDFPDLLLTPGVGARTVEALALAAEVVYGAPCRFSDPARFSMAHGGKDGHPFPVPLKVYDRTLRVMREAVDRARLGSRERLEALKRLDRESRALERAAIGPDLEHHMASERRRSAEYDGRTAHRVSAQPGLPLGGLRPGKRPG